MTFNCGTKAVHADCMNIHEIFTWGEDASFMLLVSETVDMFNIGIKVAVAFFGAALTPNWFKCLNALRCMLLAGGNNMWNFLAAVYTVLNYLGVIDTVHIYLDLYA